VIVRTDGVGEVKPSNIQKDFVSRFRILLLLVIFGSEDHVVRVGGFF